jgi:hypothetical protein
MWSSTTASRAMKSPTEWRKKAIEFRETARTMTDDGLREQYAELSARYLGQAERLDDELVTNVVRKPQAGDR